MSYDPTTIIVKIMHLDNNLTNEIRKNIDSYNSSVMNGNTSDLLENKN